MPKRAKTINLTKVSPTCNKISFEINKLDTLHLEIETGEVIKPDTKVELFIMKPDNKLVSETITTISGSTVKVDVKNGALDVAGIAIGRIKLSDSDGIVSTAPFYFTINDSFTNDEAIINSVGVEIFEDLLNRLEILENSGVSQDSINTAVNNYLTEHPVQSGATEAQAAQIEANKTAIQTVNETIGNKNELPVGDANIIASINRIDSKTSTGGTGLTPEQEAKLNSIDNKVDRINGKGLSTNDYTTEEKTTLSNLKTAVGDTNSGLIKDVKDLKTNGVSQDNINSAIENYLTQHPVQSGATAEQAAQIEANRVAIGDSNSGLTKEVNNIKNTELQNLNTAILGINETLGDKTGLPSGDTNVIASINRIDRKTGSGSGSSVDLTDYQKKTDNTLSTIDKTIVGAINEIKTVLNDKVDKVEGKTLTTNDYTNEEKQTVASLKTTVGDTNSGLVKDVKDLKTNGVSQDSINTAIENYLRDHPVQSGATTEQAAQIEANRTAIGDANSGLTKEVNNIKNTELQNLNTAIQTLETLVGVDETVGDKSGLPSGDANVIASINRIDRKTGSGSGSSVDLTDYQKKTDNTLSTIDKTIVGAINEIKTVLNDKVDKVEGKTLTTNDYTNEEKQTVASLKTTVGDTNNGLIKEVNDVKNTELQNLNTAINTLETLVGVDETVGNKTELPSGDASVIASINRIDSEILSANNILVSPDNSRFRLIVDNSGNLSTEKINN